MTNLPTITIPGVVPWQQKAVDALQEREQLLHETLFETNMDLAKQYVYLAHDYYDIGLISEGQRLVNKAEETVPGYFDNECRLQMADSPSFAQTMNNISNILLELATKPRE